MVEGGGFEPPKAEPADLQSAPFDRFGNPPQGSLTRENRRGPKFRFFETSKKPATGVEPATC